MKGFLRNTFKNMNEAGMVAPSSRFLVKKMVEPVDFEKATTIVEFGPGTGVVTRELLKRMGKDTALISMEINKGFYHECEKIVDERLTLLNQSAHTIRDVLNEKGIQEVDYVISSLPLAIIPAEIKAAILDSAKSILKPGGKYVQFQYSLTDKKRIAERFDEMTIGFTPINIPPAFVYRCVK